MPDTSPSHLFASCRPTLSPAQSPFSQPSSVLLQNQSYKHVGWIWQRDILRRASHCITSHLIHEPYMQMCRECIECIMKTQKNSQNVYGHFNLPFLTILIGKLMKDMKKKKPLFLHFYPILNVPPLFLANTTLGPCLAIFCLLPRKWQPP